MRRACASSGKDDLSRREAEVDGQGSSVPLWGLGIEATRPLCGIQRGGNRKSQGAEGVRETGASAAGRGQRPYASFPDQSPNRFPDYILRRKENGECEYDDNDEKDQRGFGE